MSGPRSINRGMDALSELARSEDGLSLAELTERLQLPKTSLLSLLRSFVAGGYVLYRDGRYELGPETFKLSAIIAQRRAFPGILRRLLERLAQDTSETAIIGVLCDDGLTTELVDVVESARSLRYMTRVGHRIAAHASSVGEAVLAFMDEEVQARFMRQCDFHAYTPRTPGREEFATRLIDVRRTGIARNIQGQDLELFGISAPVFDAQGKVICAVCVGGPVSRLEGSEARLSRGLAQAAAEMSGILGLTRPYAEMFS